ncbi:MAG: NUDIX hydrolase [Chloroflexota bacterium]
MTPPSRVRPVDAATVILVRDGDPWECFMVRRHVQSEFAADVFAFPGGKVDVDDGDPSLLEHVTGAETGDGESNALRIAALRELFEEAGVLLGRRRDGGPIQLTDMDSARLSAYRRNLHQQSIGMAAIASREDLVLDAASLVLFARWITPEPLPRRFDARFYLARMPEAQVPMHDSRETVDSTWVAPGEALRRFRTGNFPLVFATEKILERMSRFTTIEDMIASIAPGDLHPILPRMVNDGVDVRFLMPGDEGN